MPMHQPSMRALAAALAVLLAAEAHAGEAPHDAPTACTQAAAAAPLQVGDIVFIHVKPLPFEVVSEATRSWVNHVGIVVDTSGAEPVIAESTFPWSKKTPWSCFIARSAHGRYAVKRLSTPLTPAQQEAIVAQSERRLGVFYDTGFNLESKRQFCSRFVYEVLRDGAGATVGEVESFKTLFAHNPAASLTFWRWWFFGAIPWERSTVTPDSVFRSAALQTVVESAGD